MAISDKFSRVSDSNTGRPVIAQLASGKGVGATSISLNGATNWTTASKIHLAIYNTTTVSGKLIKDTSAQTEWTGDLAGTTISNLTLTGGIDQPYLAGAYVELTPTAKYAKDLYDGLAVLHNPDGTFKAGAVSTTATLADSIITTQKIADGAVAPTKWTNPYRFSATRAGSLIIPTSADTLVIMDAEDYDTNSNYSTATGLYTAPVAGIYHFNANVSVFPGSVNASVFISLYKNGATYRRGARTQVPYISTPYYFNVSLEMQLAAGDTVAPYIFAGTSASSSIEATAFNNWFTGYYVSQI